VRRSAVRKNYVKPFYDLKFSINMASGVPRNFSRSGGGEWEEFNKFS
jgi:hypothetical protein